MTWNNIISFYIILLTLASLAEANEHPVIQQYIQPNTITILGETHGHVESMNLLTDLVNHIVNNKQCLILALEIDSDEQPVLDKVMSGLSPVSEIQIPYVIDHVHYRNLIKHLVQLNKTSNCLRVLAIDSGHNNPVDRDEWMARQLAKTVGETPVLVLLGGLHTLKKVDWNTPVGTPSVAELLTQQAFRVFSLPQRWIPDKCDSDNARTLRFMGIDDPEALSVLNNSLMSLMNAKRHTSVEGVVDGLLLWECDQLPSMEN
jgi:hypothetical protein